MSRLPGIGRRSALRLALHILKSPSQQARQLSEALLRLREEIRFCSVCNNISETPVCNICNDPRRDDSLVCVVEDIRDVIAIENTGQFHGKYHVLGGIISPMDGIGPDDLHIASLTERVRAGNIREVIMALSATMEGDTTAFFIFRKLAQTGVPGLKFSTIARGVSIIALRAMDL